MQDTGRAIIGNEAADASDDPRDRVIRRVARQARHFPDLRIGTVDVAGLPDRDAGLARAIEDAVLRRWLTLGFVLESLGGHALGSLEPKMQAVLLVGSAQLVLLDRVPDHAAIDESVEWAKRYIRPKAGGMVNAVLRKVAGVRAGKRDRWTGARDELPLADGGSLALTEAILPHDDRAALSVATGVPGALLDKWRGADVRRRAWHTLVRPPTVLNVAHAQTPLTEDSAGGPGLDPADLVPHRSQGHRVYTGSHARLAAFLGARADVWAQDAASSEAAESVSDLSPRVVVDVCAGRGTKTRQVRALFPEARIVASEVDAERLAELRRVFAGDDRVEVMPVGALIKHLAGRADLVLLDVPCSNTGVLARRAEAKYRVDRGLLERLVGIQRQIIADAIPLLAPGGSILYSTCSLEHEENEDQAAWAAKWHALRPDRERRSEPAGVPGDPAGVYRDGSYSVLLRS